LSLESRKSGALDDSGVELLDQFTSAWDRYGRIVLGTVGALIVIGLVAWFTVQSNTKQENAAAEKLAEANSLFWQGDYARSRTAADEVARTFGSTKSGNDAHRISGDDAFWLGKWKEAITEYDAYLAKNNSGLIANAVRRSLAYARESDKRYGDARKLYDQLIGTFDRESSAEFLAAGARCSEAVNDKAGAIQRLQRLVNEFGDTSYANRARLELAELGAAPN